jgi:hypothetical protein
MFKKTLITILLTLSLSSHAITDRDMDKYVQSKDIVLQVLGASAYYEDNCQGLTPVGDYYRSVAMILHNINEGDLAKSPKFKSGYAIARYFKTCERIAKEFKSMGIEDFIEQD